MNAIVSSIAVAVVRSIFQDLHQDSILTRFAHCIDLKVTQLGELAFRITFVLDTLVAALSGRVGSHGGDGLPEVSIRDDSCRLSRLGLSLICKLLSVRRGKQQ